jgi:hypothetical protein
MDSCVLGMVFVLLEAELPMEMSMVAIALSGVRPELRVC